jgi:arginase
VTAVEVIGVPSQSGYRPYGTARGVGALRAAGLIAELRSHHDVSDAGDVALDRSTGGDRDAASGLIDPEGLSSMIRRVDRYVAAALASGHFPLVLGGDCPILLGCLRAARRARGATGLVHVDGHEDAYPPPASPTGDWADSEIAFALGLAAFAWDRELLREQPLVEEEHLAAIGPRDSDEIARHSVASIGARVLVLTPHALRDDPVAARDAIDRAASAPGGFWLHLDWDVLSNDEMPAVIFAKEGGLGWNELGTVMTAALSDGRCVGMDAGTYNPDLDPDGRVAIRIVDELSRWLDHVPDPDAGTLRL